MKLLACALIPSDPRQKKGLQFYASTLLSIRFYRTYSALHWCILMHSLRAAITRLLVSLWLWGECLMLKGFRILWTINIIRACTKILRNLLRCVCDNKVINVFWIDCKNGRIKFISDFSFIDWFLHENEKKTWNFFVYLFAWLIVCLFVFSFFIVFFCLFCCFVGFFFLLFNSNESTRCAIVKVSYQSGIV